MQQALPYNDRLPSSSSSPPPRNADRGGDRVREVRSLRLLLSENAVVVLGRKGCCMCHVVKLLLHGHGVSPVIVDVDEMDDVACGEVSGGDSAVEMQFPAVFIGGEMYGGVEEIIGAHISGELVPRLREARALWL